MPYRRSQLKDSVEASSYEGVSATNEDDENTILLRQCAYGKELVATALRAMLVSLPLRALRAKTEVVAFIVSAMYCRFNQPTSARPVS